MSEPQSKREPRRTFPQIVTVDEGTSTAAPPKRTFGDFLFGRRLASAEEEEHKIGTLAGIPVLGLDALSSAAYGPEAALTLLAGPDRGAVKMAPAGVRKSSRRGRSTRGC
jgi:hypothetical protein